MVVVSPAIMFATVYYYMPFYNFFINRLRGAIYGAHTFTGASIALAWYGYTVNGNQQLSSVVVLVNLIAWCLGFVLGYWWIGAHYEHTQTSCYREVLRKIEVANTHTEQPCLSSDHETNKLVFSCPAHVEITARGFTTYLSERRKKIEECDMDEIHKIFRRGIYEFPDDASVRLAYATYIFHLERDGGFDASKHFQKVAMLNPSASIQFQLYYFRQLSMHVLDTRTLDDDGGQLDIATFAEFRKIDQLARLNHCLAETALQELWQLLLNKRSSETEKLVDIERVSMTLYNTAFKADKFYVQLVTRFPKSKNYLRMYSKFSYEIMGDTNKGNALSTRAKILERTSGDNDYEFDRRPSKTTTSNREQTSASRSKALLESPSGSKSQLLAKLASKNKAAGKQRDLTSPNQKRRSIGSAHEDSKSATSRSSSEQATSDMRLVLHTKLRAEIQALRISAIMITLLFLAVFIVMYFVIDGRLQETQQGLDIRTYTTAREYYNSELFLRARNMLGDYYRYSQAKFSAEQTKIKNAASNLSDAAWWLYANIPDSELQDVVVNKTLYPTTPGKLQETIAIFEFTMDVGIVDIQEMIGNSTINVLLAISIVGEALVLILLALYIYKFNAFLTKQRNGYRVFLGISRPAVAAQARLWDEIVELDMLGIAEKAKDIAHEASKQGDQQTTKLGQLYFASTGIVAIITALVIYNVVQIIQANAQFLLTNLFGTIRTYVSRGYSMAYESAYYDPSVWDSVAEQNAVFLHDISTLHDQILKLL
eukprot:jgi/Hompol1/2427/HPOL_002914-RA